jgi:glutathione S-transferase
MFRERMRTMPPEMRERRFRNVGDPRRRDRYKSTYELGTQSPFVLHAVAAYERAFKLMEATLAERGPWILGATPTLADINMMPFVARLAYMGLLEAWTANRPHINAWWTRVQAWPSFRRGLHDLISEAEFIEMRVHGPKIRGEVDALIAGLRQEQAAA